MVFSQCFSQTLYNSHVVQTLSEEPETETQSMQNRAVNRA